MSTDETLAMPVSAAADDHGPTLVSLPPLTSGGWDLTRQLPAPCRCGMCPAPPQEPAGLAMLSYAPGVVARMHDARVRNGQWDDIPALFDEAHGDVHKPAIKAQRNIGRALNDGYGHLSLVFSCHPEWRTDAALAEGLRTKADELAADLDDMRRAAAQREAELKQRAAERQHAAELGAAA